MRVLLIGSANTWRMEAAVEAAFRRAGHETLLLDDRRIKRRIGRRLTQHWVRARARRFSPDFVFLSKCMALDVDTVHHLVQGVPNAMWYHDPQWHRDTARPDIAHILAMAHIAGAFFVTGFEREWRAHGVDAKFLPAAGDASIRPVPPEPRFTADVTFVGTAYDSARARLLLEIARHHQVRVWGLGWEEWAKPLNWGGRPVEHRDFAAVCASSKVVLGINHGRAGGANSYTSDRTWMALLAGAFYLGEGGDGVAGMLQEGRHCAWYDDPASCLEQLGHYLSDHAARARISASGERFVRAHHTYDQRIENLIANQRFTNPLTAEVELAPAPALSPPASRV